MNTFTLDVESYLTYFVQVSHLWRRRLKTSQWPYGLRFHDVISTDNILFGVIACICRYIQTLQQYIDKRDQSDVIDLVSNIILSWWCFCCKLHFCIPVLLTNILYVVEKTTAYTIGFLGGIQKALPYFAMIREGYTVLCSISWPCIYDLYYWTPLSENHRRMKLVMKEQT